jgi:hypothetical protein
MIAICRVSVDDGRPAGSNHYTNFNIDLHPAPADTFNRGSALQTSHQSGKWPPCLHRNVEARSLGLGLSEVPRRVQAPLLCTLYSRVRLLRHVMRVIAHALLVSACCARIASATIHLKVRGIADGAATALGLHRICLLHVRQCLQGDIEAAQRG